MPEEDRARHEGPTQGEAMTPNDALELEDAVVADDEADDEVDELLVEEVSIDGMCGVY